MTGVVKSFAKGPPRSISTGQIPAKWVQMPSGSEAPVHKGVGARSWQTLRAELVVAVEPTGQGNYHTNFDGMVDMMDAVADALAAITGLGKKAPVYEIRGDATVVVNEKEYWAVVATVEVEG